jgi:hypothetical protein
MKDQVLQTIPPEVRHLYADPPLLSSEDADEYYLLLKGMIEDDPPRNLSEWIYKNDYLDNAWHAVRLRKMKIHRWKMDEKLAAADTLRRVLPFDVDNHSKIQRLSSDWMSNAEATAEVAGILQQHGLSSDSVGAMALTRAGEHLTLIEDMEERAIRRRDQALCEIRRGREELIVAAPKMAKSKRVEAFDAEDLNLERLHSGGIPERPIDLSVEDFGAQKPLPVADATQDASPNAAAAALSTKTANAAPQKEPVMTGKLYEALLLAAPIGDRTGLNTKNYAKLAGIR